MIPPPPKQPRRLDPKVPHLLLPAIERTVRIRRLELVFRSFELLLLRVRQRLLLRLLGLEVREHGAEVAQLEFGDVGVVGLFMLFGKKWGCDVDVGE